MFHSGESRAIRPEELTVYSNEYQRFLVIGGGTVPTHLLGNNYEIDLTPRGPAEKNDYNRYLHNYVSELIIHPEKFHVLVEEKYDSFLFEPPYQAFTQQLPNALDREKTIANEIRRIETTFAIGTNLAYLDNIYPYRIEDHQRWQSALLNAFVNGSNYDFSRRQLTVYDVKALIHAEQIFSYYKELLQLKTQSNRPGKEVRSEVSDLNRRFEREFEKANLPFAEILEQNSSFKKELLHQFALAQAKPCFELYLADYYSEEELRKGFEAAHKATPVSTAKEVVAAQFVARSTFEILISELHAEFSLKMAKMELPESYFCPDIEKTIIVTALREIHGEYEI